MIITSHYWWFFTATILTLAAAWTWLSRVPEASGVERIPSPREGFPAPDFTMTTLEGEAVTLSAQRGKVVVVNLWASWCEPCRAEMPTIQKLYNANRERGLEVLAVNSTIQDSEVGARSFVAEMGLTFPILLDTDGSVSRRYLLRALPSTFIVDREGIIRAVIIGGPVSEALLQSKIEELLTETQ
ncbi:MAG TPA: TlpA disulfide reductase family protein [Anaerolineales bacterium]|nr:TlpA disulfide reductase family protein [Anaerolineales bacterium]